MFDWSPTLVPPPAPNRRTLPVLATADERATVAERVAGPLIERGFRPDIEGLRAIAVVLVILYHFDLLGVRGGYVGVDVFFVISGFLITQLLVGDATSGQRVGSVLATFYARRFRRLLALASVVLVATTWASYHWLGFLRGRTVASDARWAAGFMANIHFARIGTDYLGSQQLPSPIQHFWSLAVEEQFYVVWPVVILLLARWTPPAKRRIALRAGLVVIVAASFAWCVHQTSSNGTWAYFSPLTRAWELAVGALVAVTAVEMRRVPRPLAWAVGALGVSGIVVAAFAFDNGTRFPGVAAALPVGATALVILAGSGRNTRLGVLGFQPLQWIGKLSYSLYLWHWPVLVIADGRREGAMDLQGRLDALALAIALSIVTFFVVEQPIRRSRYLAPRRALTLAIGACCIAGTLVLVSQHREPSTRRAAPQEIPPASLTPPRTSTSASGSPSSPATTVATETPAVALESPEAIAAAVQSAAAIDRLPDDVQPSLEDAPTDFENLDVTGCSDADRDPSLGRCVYGDPSGEQLVVLFGDSHAGMWLTAAHLAALDAGWQLRMFSKAGCPAPTITFYDRQNNRVNSACDDYRSATVADIAELHPAVVIVTSASLAQSVSKDEIATADAWEAGMTETLRALRADGTRVVLLGDMPVLESTNPDCLAAHPDDIQQCGSPRETALDGVYTAAEAAAATAGGADYIDVTDWFCSDRCSPVVAGRQVYRNRYHVTAAFAEFVAGGLASALHLDG